MILIVIYRFHLIYETPLLQQALPQVVVEVQCEEKDPNRLPILPQKSIFLPCQLRWAPMIPIKDKTSHLNADLKKLDPVVHLIQNQKTHPSYYWIINSLLYVNKFFKRLTVTLVKIFSKLNNKKLCFVRQEEVYESFIFMTILLGRRAYYCLLSVLIFVKTYQIMQKKPLIFWKKKNIYCYY